MLGERIIVVDLYSGRFLNEETGHELFNLTKNSEDGMYYGYVPSYDNVNIKRIYKNAKGSIDNVLVVYVQAISESNKNREIIAFCTDAIVFDSPQHDKINSRKITYSNGKQTYATYSIKSDNLIDLRSLPNKFTIQIADYNVYMFRSQRSYLEKYPSLKSDIVNYILMQKKLHR